MSKCSRRSALGAIAGMVACAATDAPALAGIREEEGLGVLAARKGLLFGAAMMHGELALDSQSLFAREVRVITPSNELKMTSVLRTPDQVDFTEADALIAFADRQKLKVRGHTLIWNEYQPQWVYKLRKEEIAGLIDRYIDLVCSRYRGRIHSWDVVNEPLATDSSEKNWLHGGPYFGALGQDYIAHSLRRARAADPTGRLFINETHTERDDSFGLRQRKRLLRLIDDLQHAGLPLDGVGLQGHLDPSAPFKPDGFMAFCDEIAKRNLEIQITELDVNDERFPDDIATRDTMVAETMSRFLNAALKCRAVKLVATWHLADNFSFPYRESVAKNPHAKRRPRPVLFDENLRRKLAWHAVARAISDAPPRA